MAITLCAARHAPLRRGAGCELNAGAGETAGAVEGTVAGVVEGCFEGGFEGGFDALPLARVFAPGSLGIAGSSARGGTTTGSERLNSARTPSAPSRRAASIAF